MSNPLDAQLSGLGTRTFPFLHPSFLCLNVRFSNHSFSGFSPSLPLNMISRLPQLPSSSDPLAPKLSAKRNLGQDSRTEYLKKLKETPLETRTSSPQNREVSPSFPTNISVSFSSPPSVQENTQNFNVQISIEHSGNSSTTEKPLENVPQEPSSHSLEFSFESSAELSQPVEEEEQKVSVAPSPVSIPPPIEPVSAHLADLRMKIFQKIVFGKQQWEESCPHAKFGFGNDTEDYPSLPNAVLESLPLIEKYEFLLIRMPETVEGKAYSPDILEGLFKKTFPKYKPKIIIIDPRLKEKIGNQTVMKSYWFLISIKRFGDSLGMGFHSKMVSLKGWSQHLKLPLQLPRAFEVATAHFAHLFKKKTNLFYDLQFATYCEETIQMKKVTKQVIVGEMVCFNKGFSITPDKESLNRCILGTARFEQK